MPNLVIYGSIVTIRAFPLPLCVANYCAKMILTSSRLKYLQDFLLIGLIPSRKIAQVHDPGYLAFVLGMLIQTDELMVL